MNIIISFSRCAVPCASAESEKSGSCVGAHLCVWCAKSSGECSAYPSGVGGDPGLPGLDAPLDDGGGVAVERGEGGEDMEEIDEPRVLRRLIAAAADMRRPLDEGERSDEPRIRWLYLQ